MRSSRARGELFLLRPRHARRVRQDIQKYSKRFGVRIYHFANAGNHLHIIAKGKSREGIQSFLRKAPGSIAQAVTGAKKGRPFGRFWDELIYSRVVEWGKSFQRVLDYVTLNEIEAAGVEIAGLRKAKKGRSPPS